MTVTKVKICLRSTRIVSNFVMIRNDLEIVWNMLLIKYSSTPFFWRSFSPELLYLDENSQGLTKKSGIVQQKKPLTINDMYATINANPNCCSTLTLRGIVTYMCRHLMCHRKETTLTLRGIVTNSLLGEAAITLQPTLTLRGIVTTFS